MQLSARLNSVAYYGMVFAATVRYYTYAYLDDTNPNADNERSRWYERNRRLVFYSQVLLTIFFVVAMIVFIVEQPLHLFKFPFYYWCILLVFPLTALLYYGVQMPSSQRYNLRDTGWLKPFFIGFVWAGAVTVYPVLFSDLAKGVVCPLGVFKILLFIKNFIFITVLSIMFDIKDYANDYNSALKTFVVQLGLRKTIFYILLPLCVLGLGVFLGYAFVHHFPLLRIVLNTIPFVLLIFVAYSMYQRKSILYYLAVIDGLMLVKAICGSLGILLTS
jgi:4-hydroxybenzoate polyprenyltransferase